MTMSRMDAALRMLEQGSSSAAGPSSQADDPGPSQPNAPGAMKRKRVHPAPPELNPGSGEIEPLDLGGPDVRGVAAKRKKPLLPGVRPEDDYQPDPDSDDDDEEYQPEQGDRNEMPTLHLPSLTQAAHSQATRGQLNLNNEDDTVLDIDQGGPNQAQEVARFFAENQTALIAVPSVQEAIHKLGLESNDDLMPGLDVKLLGHQFVGVAWMLDKENNPRERGGILADDMGLGKTVQALGLMVANPPDFTQEDQRADRRKSTLIIAPAALLDQWRDEVETKADMFRVFIHHGPSKAKSVQVLRKYDVVVTSYHTMLADVNPRKNREGKGPLGETLWYRIILDEAQIIRNRLAHISQATARLNSRYRWSLSGTPFTNGLADLYPLLRFARLRPWNDWDSFKLHIGGTSALKDAEASTAKMAVIVKKHLLRRKKDDKIDGQPILQLPPKTIEIVYVDFTPEEQRIYDAVLKRQQITISRFHRAGTLVKNYQFVMVMILRLRQVCCHPQLISYAANEIAAPDAERVLGEAFYDGGGGEEAAIKTLAEATEAMGQAAVVRLQQEFKDKLQKKLRTEIMGADDDADEDDVDECPICYDYPTAPHITICGHMFCRDCIEGVFQAQVEYEDDVGAPTRPCPNCRRNIKQNQLMSVQLFQPTPAEIEKIRTDFEREKKKRDRGGNLSFDITLDDSDDDLPDADDWWTSKSKKKASGKGGSGAKFSSKKKKGKEKIKADPDVLELSDDSVVDLTQDGPSRASASPNVKRSGKAKGKVIAVDSSSDNDSMRSDRDSDISEDGEGAFRAEMLDGILEFENSAKIQQMVELLQKWREECPEDKCVIYSQWTTCLNLLEAALERDSIRSLRYDGSMTREERTDVVKRFKKRNGPSVLLVSLKCGGVGLNLVEANRVICFDPAWNFASESQAYDRVHRIGQSKEVHVKRLIVRGSIEERILEIQQGKKDLTDAALGEGNGLAGSVRRLGVGDILAMFNMGPGNRRRNS